MASVLGRRYGVQVEIGGEEAYTDGKTIHIPALPLDADDTLLTLARGYIDHEAAHIRFTDFEALSTQAKDELDRFLWNALEDYRVEHAMSALYPGCRNNYNRLIKELFKEEAESTDFASLVLNWLIRRLRSYDVPELQSQCASMANVAGQTAPGLLTDIEAELEDFVSQPRTCAESFEYAQRIRALLEQVSRTKQQSKMQKPAPVDKEEQRGDPSTETQEERSTSAKCSQEETAEEAEENATPLDWNSAVPQAEEERLTQKLSAAACPADTQDCIRVAGVSTGHNAPLPPEELSRVRRATSALKARLAGLLQARSYRGRESSYKGRLDTKNLHTLSFNGTRVFQRDVPKLAVDTAVHILLDISGSMQRDIMEACTCCYAVADALQISGISVGVTAFPIYDVEEVPQKICPILRHGERMHTRFLMTAQGTTPMADALWAALQELAQQRDPRKLVLVITDGIPDSEPAMRNAMQVAHAMDVELYGLGIRAPYISTLIPHSHSITRLEELPDALFGLLSHTL